MEDLIALVAASFARYGIECPATDTDNDRKVVEKQASSPVPADPTTLPEHNFRKDLQGDPVP